MTREEKAKEIESLGTMISESNVLYLSDISGIDAIIQFLYWIVCQPGAGAGPPSARQSWARYDNR